MISHLFKLIWNKKKQNFLLITEMFVSFLVMFAVFTMIVRAYNNYRHPLGFEYDDVWVASYMTPENIQSDDSAALFQDVLRKQLQSFPQVVEAGFSGHNFPFAMTMSNSMVSSDQNEGVMTNFYNADDNYLKVLNAKMLSGRWFSKADDVSKSPVVVINRKLQEELFEGKNAIGKYIEYGGDRLKVIGVMENMKDKGTYTPVENGLFKRIDAGAAKWTSNILIKVKPGADAVFEGKLFKALSNTIGTSVEIEHMDKKLTRQNKLSLIPMIIMLVVGGFLIINVALGLFGVLWYNINKRRSEIGLRRAVGASGNSVSKQLVGESLVLSTLALLIGLFFAIQFPLLKVFDLPASVYLVAIALSVAFIYILVFLCALYPGRQAAAIYPAVALHEE
ncbi:ABC transporter permease [Chitinophagaceae bacterium LB-8]|uniref:ABC transporter permease n=1 Tax=Paraflavisolibacter caeni TaxID=2982496 RepID=A0A9X2XVT7_9BACT|nr:ABC transporter permease [Paraflavisolibacter caeni]MCU7549377.1 ABC transporter permease [Paraflavisolibacter caeni]